jgi:hypothetical protein
LDEFFEWQYGTTKVISLFMFTDCDVALLVTFFLSSSSAQRGLWLPRPRGLRAHTKQRATVGRTPLDELSARRRDL